MNVVLIGMPGAGKSTLGVLLADALGLTFVDTDILIQKSEGRLLQEIINTDGIEGFLKAEEIAILGLQAEGTVIATGGSVVYSEAAMAHLKRGGLVVYLEAPFDEIENRLNDISTRGVVIKPGSSLKDVYDERVPLYKKYGDLTATCSEKDVEGAVNALAAAVKEIIRNSSF